MVLEGQNVDVAPQPSIATKGNLTFDDINSKVKPNLERVVKFQQENNQTFRDVVGWLKTNYENGNITESEVVTEFCVICSSINWVSMTPADRLTVSSWNCSPAVVTE